MEATISKEVEAKVLDMARGIISGGPLRATAQVKLFGLGDPTTYTPQAEDAGTVFIGVNGLSIALPAANTCKGCAYTLINGAADGTEGATFRPATGNVIVGTVGDVTAAGVPLGKWYNTAATAIRGDYTTVVSDGNTTWYIVGGVGVWEVLTP
jgi:hypothetical protein